MEREEDWNQWAVGHALQTSEGSAVGWVLSVYPTAGEASGCLRYAGRGKSPPSGLPDPERSRQEAARRARGQIRRYCAANRLNRLGTLTYAGEGCHDPRQFRTDVAGFFRQLRGDLGGKPFPYLWVPEWHKKGHGLHGHFGVGGFVPRGLIESAWGRGFIGIKLLGDLPVGSGRLAEARKVAGYLAKYVGKAIDEERVPGLHRYEVAQGFQPERSQVWGRTADAALQGASTLMGGQRPARVWLSSQEPNWDRPPSVWASWGA